MLRRAKFSEYETLMHLSTFALRHLRTYAHGRLRTYVRKAMKNRGRSKVTGNIRSTFLMVLTVRMTTCSAKS